MPPTRDRGSPPPSKSKTMSAPGWGKNCPMLTVPAHQEAWAPVDHTGLSPLQRPLPGPVSPSTTTGHAYGAPRVAGTHLLGPKDYGHHALRLGGLCALIDEDGTELHLGQSWVTSTHTSAADDICVLGKARASGHRHSLPHHASWLRTRPGVPCSTPAQQGHVCRHTCVHASCQGLCCAAPGWLSMHSSPTTGQAVPSATQASAPQATKSTGVQGGTAFWAQSPALCLPTVSRTVPSW